MSTQHYALIGHPLGHTMSPPIHKRLFELSGNLDADYIAQDIPLEKFDDVADQLFQLNGFNITIPYKIKMLRHLDQLDLSAKRYGAVNVVKCGEKNIGYNTDVTGFLRSIEMLGTDLTGKVLLLGCGGAGRMMAIETALAGGDLTIAVRESSYEKAENTYNNIKLLSPESSVHITSLQAVTGKYDLILNATPSGMYPHNAECPVSPEVAGNTAFLFDAIYNPRETQLMKLAKANGAKVMGGMNMLVWQAAVSHEIWEDASYSKQDIQALVEEMEELVTTQFGG